MAGPSQYQSGNQNIITSVYGKRLGLQFLSTSVSGGSRNAEILVGPDAGVRAGVTTAATTGTNIPAYGFANLPGTSAGSSCVYTIDPPIPGVPVLVTFVSSANGNCYLKTLNSETIVTTFGSSFTVVKSTGTGCFWLYGVTTGIWMSEITSGTTANSAGFALTTTT